LQFQEDSVGLENLLDGFELPGQGSRSHGSRRYEIEVFRKQDSDRSLGALVHFLEGEDVAKEGVVQAWIEVLRASDRLALLPDLRLEDLVVQLDLGPFPFFLVPFVSFVNQSSIREYKSDIMPM
jgi:hypothetical protein